MAFRRRERLWNEEDNSSCFILDVSKLFNIIAGTGCLEPRQSTSDTGSHAFTTGWCYSPFVNV